jgi:hypothetical protein
LQHGSQAKAVAALARVLLRAWQRFALTRRPVIAAGDIYLPDFRGAFDDETSWGPAKQIVKALTHRGVDLTDRDTVDQSIHQLNAENLAHRLLPQAAGPERT